MAHAIYIQDHEDSETFSGPEKFMSRVQDETLSSRKKLVFEPTRTSTTSAAASLACAFGVALVSATDVTAGIDDFLSQQLLDITFGTDATIKKWDIRSQFSLNSSNLTTQQTSSYQATSGTVSELISFIRNHVPLAYSARLANRLEYLREASIEEAPEQAYISVNSLQSFISFIKKETKMKEPDIVLTYTGNIRAEWHKSRKEHFSVEFLPNGQVRYVVFAPDLNHATRTDRTSGLVSAETLMNKVNPLNVLAWAAS